MIYEDDAAPVGPHVVPESSSARGRTLTPAQLMERLQISENTCYEALQNGFLKEVSFKVGRQWRVSEAALERLMACELPQRP